MIVPMPRRDIWPWLGGSLVLASASALGPFLVQSVIDVGQSLALSAAWLLLFLIVLVVKKKQGLWLLIGAPFAAYMPVVAIAIMSACSQNIKNCP